jgi:hypothetical protein
MFAEVCVKPELDWLLLGDNVQGIVCSVSTALNVQGIVCSVSTALNVDADWTPPISQRLASISIVAFGFCPS